LLQGARPPAKSAARPDEEDPTAQIGSEEASASSSSESD